MTRPFVGGMVAARYDAQLDVFRSKLDVTGNINPSYVRRAMRMTLLATEIMVRSWRHYWQEDSRMG